MRSASGEDRRRTSAIVDVLRIGSRQPPAEPLGVAFSRSAPAHRHHGSLSITAAIALDPDAHAVVKSGLYLNQTPRGGRLEHVTGFDNQRSRATVCFPVDRPMHTGTFPIVKPGLEVPVADLHRFVPVGDHCGRHDQDGSNQCESNEFVERRCRNAACQVFYHLFHQRVLPGTIQWPS